MLRPSLAAQYDKRLLPHCSSNNVTKMPYELENYQLSRTPDENNRNHNVENGLSNMFRDLRVKWNFSLMFLFLLGYISIDKIIFLMKFSTLCMCLHLNIPCNSIFSLIFLHLFWFLPVKFYLKICSQVGFSTSFSNYYSCNRCI